MPRVEGLTGEITQEPVDRSPYIFPRTRPLPLPPVRRPLPTVPMPWRRPAPTNPNTYPRK